MASRKGRVGGDGRFLGRLRPDGPCGLLPATGAGSGSGAGKGKSVGSSEGV